MSTKPGEVSAVELDRRAFRRRQRRRSLAIAAISTVVVVAVLVAAVVSTPGWARVKETFLDWDVAWASLPRIWSGLLVNLQVLAIAAVAVLVVGSLVAVLRTTTSPVLVPVRGLLTVYTDVFRGLPLIIVLFIVGLGIPGLRLQGAPSSPFVLGTIALVLTYSAYVAEVCRAGIVAVHPSQWAAGRSLGLTYWQTLRIVVLPQALRTVWPPLLNDFVAMQKDVGLISVLGAVDAVRAAQIETAEHTNFTPYLVAGVLFILLAVPTARIADYAASRARRRERAGLL